RLRLRFRAFARGHALRCAQSLHIAHLRAEQFVLVRITHRHGSPLGNRSHDAQFAHDLFRWVQYSPGMNADWHRELLRAATIASGKTLWLGLDWRMRGR